jgi:hypothetical protein
MKRILSLLFLSVIVNSARADYEALEIKYMAVAADLIVSGEIASVKVSTFIFKIQEHIAGKPDTVKYIEVEKFENWTCASRYSPYQAGQKALLFLKKSKNNKWYTMSAGNEGEARIEGNNVFVWESWKYTGAPALPAREYGTGFSLKDMIAAIKDFRSCHKTIPGDYHSVDRTCSSAQAAAYIKRSEAHRFLFSS